MLGFGKTTLACAALIGAGMLPMATSADERPTKAGDLNYGMALFDYHQGNSFDALIRLEVARSGDGIKGHGDHPELVRGGLMLAYGMTASAEELFRELLADSLVSEEARNQAWFYLGKVFWLEQDFLAAQQALERVDGELLEDSDESLYAEWLYLRGQLQIQSNGGSDWTTALEDIESELPDDSIYRPYLGYNRAVRLLSDGLRDEAEVVLDDVAESAQDRLAGMEEGDVLAAEWQAIVQKIALSQARLALSDEQSARALEHLSGISLDGVFSDQALFDFAVAASQQNEPGLALTALTQLQQRPLFTPWLQQVPYALAYTQEQMGRERAALEAFQEAARHYEDLQARIEIMQASMDETALIAALNFLREGAETGQIGEDGTVPMPGDEAILVDPYGRVAVEPRDYGLAELLATETFQIALRDLHELYRLQSSLAEWRRQLDSFDVMLNTREARREQRIQETLKTLDSLQVEQWQQRQEAFRENIARAVRDGDARFFMTQEQKKLNAKLEEVAATLARLPVTGEYEEQRATFRRMKAYFDWWVSDEFGINRWSAESALRELDAAMFQYRQQRGAIDSLIAKDPEIESLRDRIEGHRARLQVLEQQLGQAVMGSRNRLLSEVTGELNLQKESVAGYLRASRHAAARLSDALFTASTAVPGQVDVEEEREASTEANDG